MGIFRGATGTGTSTPAFSDVVIDEIEGYVDTASTKADEASASALSAQTSAANASASEIAANLDAISALASAQAASDDADAAAVSAQSAENAYDDFDDRYLGAKTSDPTLDNDGDALSVGALYYNTSIGQLRIYSGSVWEDAVSASGLTQATADTLYEPLLDGQTRQQFFRQDDPPDVIADNLLEGDMWYETDTEDFYFWREVSTNVFTWVLLVSGSGNSDTLDGGAY
jgi:hypothetical protein